MKFVKRSEDRRFILMVIVTFTIELFLIQIKHFSFFEYLLLLIIFTFISFWAAIVNHTHQHQPIFESRSLNLLLNFILTFLIGAPATRLHVVHLLNHHENYKNENDWSSFSIVSHLTGLRKSLTYIIKVTIKIWKNRIHLPVSIEFKKRQDLERVALMLYTAALIFWLPKNFLSLILPAWIVGWSLLLLANLINHDGCEIKSQFHHSRDFVNKFENWIFLNNGYHSAHHLYPEIHWSDLPHYHQQAFINKHRQFEENLFFSYLFLHYLRPFSNLFLRKNQHSSVIS